MKSSDDYHTKSYTIGINVLNLRRELGGQYQYAMHFVKSIIETDQSNTYVLFCDSTDFLEDISSISRSPEVVFVDNPHESMYPLRGILRFAALFGIYLSPRFGAGKYWAIKERGVDLLLQPYPGVGALISTVPFVVTIHDLWHREVQGAGGWLSRKLYDLRLNAIANQSQAVLVDSDHLKQSLIRHYHVKETKIHILRFRPPDYITLPYNDLEFTLQSVKSRYDLPDNYLLYPSGFVEHKNHQKLLEALMLLKQQGVIVPLILIGPQNKLFSAVMRFIKEHRLTEQVRYLGYVPDGDMGALYRLATALVFPSLLGPTCIPVVEAFSVGCPVICTDLPGYREQVRDAAMMVDSLEPTDIARGIREVWTDPSLRQELRERGLKRSIELNDEGFGQEIVQVLQQVLRL